MKRIVPLVLLAFSLHAQFRPALPGYRFEFPRDHFAHPAFEIEWWYYTGNLTTQGGRRFGFELTFFRNAIERQEPISSSWDVDQLYLAHFALSDIDGGQFFQAERLNRAGPDLAGASLEQTRIWNGNWRVDWSDPGNPLAAQSLQAVAKEFSIQLELRPRKHPIINGEDGVSRKAAGEGKASHYMTFPRLDARGVLQLGEADFEVEGSAWMDHEFSTDSMGEDQVGWDWLSLQLDDGSEFLLYRLRKADGTTDPHSAGTYIAPDGSTRRLNADDFSMTPSATWTSPETGGAYPLQWQVEAPQLGLSATIGTLLDAQEIVPTRGRGPAYWEGAIDVSGTKGNAPVAGVGYLEMTGYADQLRLGVARRGQ